MFEISSRGRSLAHKILYKRNGESFGKSQFGKSIYGEVIDKVLRETSTKAISEKNRLYNFYK